MKIGGVIAFALALGLRAAAAEPAGIETHLLAAKQAAGFDFTGTLARVCLVPRAGQARRSGPRVIPARSTWYAEPAQVFDNLYFVGTRIHSAWALKTSGGIVLIDTLYNYAVEPEIVAGLKKLGLDPASVKYVIVTHAHGDHDEGARLMQARDGSHIVMGAADWDSIEKQATMPGGPPRRDIAVGPSGTRLTLGDTALTVIATPGHTPGTLSLIFPVKDHGRTLNVVYSGGTAFNFPDDAGHYDIYIDSQRKLARAAAQAHASVLMSNHSEFDNAYTKIRLLAARKPGEAHPFDIGAAAVARYFVVTSECAQARKLELNGGKP